MSLTILVGAPLPRRRLDREVMLFILSSRMAEEFGLGFLKTDMVLSIAQTYVKGAKKINGLKS